MVFKWKERCAAFGFVPFVVSIGYTVLRYLAVVGEQYCDGAKCEMLGKFDSQYTKTIIF